MERVDDLLGGREGAREVRNLELFLQSALAEWRPRG